MKTKPGETLDTMHSRFREQTRILKRQITALTRQGCLKAYPHYKAGTKRMYLLEPTDGTGRRPYTYVGGDTKKQKAVLAKIERFYKRESLQSSLNALEVYQARIEGDLSDLLRDFAWAVAQGDNAIKAGEKFRWTWGATEGGQEDRYYNDKNRAVAEEHNRIRHGGEVTRGAPGPRRGVTTIQEEEEG